MKTSRLVEFDRDIKETVRELETEEERGIGRESTHDCCGPAVVEGTDALVAEDLERDIDGGLASGRRLDARLERVKGEDDGPARHASKATRYKQRPSVELVAGAAGPVGKEGQIGLVRAEEGKVEWDVARPQGREPFEKASEALGLENGSHHGHGGRLGNCDDRVGRGCSRVERVDWVEVESVGGGTRHWCLCF